VAIGLSAVAGLGHQLVSYTTAKAQVDLGHRYEGALVGGGHGRDLRLLVLCLGAAGAVVTPWALAVGLAVVAVLTWGIVAVRLRASWWATGPGRTYLAVKAVAFDFDGTLADSMPYLSRTAVDLLSNQLGLAPAVARAGYLSTSGLDFRSQLAELQPGHPDLDRLADEFETAKSGWMPGCGTFPDVVSALQRLRAAGVPTLVCSSTRQTIVEAFCARHGLTDQVTAITGWAPDRPKASQLAGWIAASGLDPATVLFVGDACRDAQIATSVGVRFVGLVRAGADDAFVGTGVEVVPSLETLARRVARASRLPVRLATPAVQAVRAESVEVGSAVGQHQLPAITGDGHRGDGAVVDLDVPVDLGTDGQRPRHRSADNGVMGEHDGDALVG
jgi:phosphoglycolate phosphatase-like HAD superfamily hydrolase